MMTHKEALRVAVDGWFGSEVSEYIGAHEKEDYAADMEVAIRAYLDARKLVMVPEADPSDGVLSGAIKVYESFGKKMNGMCNVRRFFLAVAPDPFGDE